MPTHTLYYCQLTNTNTVMRHPVYVVDDLGDGNHYELKTLSNWMRNNAAIDPISRRPITSVSFTTELEKIINTDEEVLTQRREPPYEKEQHIAQIKQLLPSPFTSSVVSFFRHNGVKAGVAGLSTYLAIMMFYHSMHQGELTDAHIQEDIQKTHSVALGMAVTGLDYAIRTMSSNRFSLSSVLGSSVRALATTLVEMQFDIQDFINPTYRR